MARSRNTRETKHVQVDLGKRSFERLARLKELTEAGSYSEVFSDALALYEAFANDVLVQGNEIFIREKEGGELKQYRIIL